MFKEVSPHRLLHQILSESLMEMEISKPCHNIDVSRRTVNPSIEIVSFTINIGPIPTSANEKGAGQY